MWQPTHVKVTVRQARDLLIKGKNGTNDAFVVIGIGKEKYQTSVKHKSGPSLHWREECELSIPSQGNKASLQLTVYHHNSLGIDEFLGQVNFPLNDIDVYEKPKYKFHKLLGKPDQSKKKQDKDRGELEILVNFTVKSGSYLDISKKEKTKSTNSLKHLSGSLLSFGGSKDKHGLKDFARSVSSKMDKITKKKKSKSKKDSGDLPNELLESQQHFGDADPGVISDDDDDEFRFDDDVKVYTQSNSPQSTLSRGSSFMHEPVYDAPVTPPLEPRRKSLVRGAAPPIQVDPPSPAVVQESGTGVFELSNHSFYSANDKSPNDFHTPGMEPQVIEEEALPDFTDEQELKWGRDALVFEPQEELYSVKTPNKKESEKVFDKIQEKSFMDGKEFHEDKKVISPSSAPKRFDSPLASKSNEEEQKIKISPMQTQKKMEIITSDEKNNQKNHFAGDSFDKKTESEKVSETIDSDSGKKKKKQYGELKSINKTEHDVIIPKKDKSPHDQSKKRLSFTSEKNADIFSKAKQDDVTLSPVKPKKDFAKNDFDASISRTGSLNEGQTNRPKALPRSAMTGSNGNVSLNDSQNSLNVSRTSSSYDVRKEDFRQPEIKALTLDRRHNGDDGEPGEGRKRKKIAAFKNKLFHNKGSRDRFDEDSRYVEGGNDKTPTVHTRSSKLPQEIHDKFSGKSREDLLEIILNLQGSLSKQVQHSNDLEDYIDNLLLRVMEATPDILYSSSGGRRIKSFGSY